MQTDWRPEDVPRDMTAWEILCAMSPPIENDPDRGHEMHIADWKVVDGGVVEHRYMAMCRCYWTQRWPCNNRDDAVAAWERHLHE